MPPKKPQQQQPPTQPVQQQASTGKGGKGVKTTTVSTKADSAHFKAGGNVDVVSWLAKKTGVASQGAIAYLNEASSPAIPAPASQQRKNQQQQQHPAGGADAAGSSTVGDLMKLQERIRQQNAAEAQGHHQGKTPSMPAPKSASGALPQPKSQLQQQQQGKGGKQQQQPSSKQQQQQQQAPQQKKRGEPTSRPRPPQGSTPPTPPADSPVPEEHMDPMQQLDPEMQTAMMLAQATHHGICESIAAQDAHPGRPPTLDLASLLEVIDEHQVTIVCTDTGTGKSSALPNALLDADVNHRIVSSQPRRTATISIAEHVARMRGERVGDNVGYWIRGAKAGDEGTRLWYLTSYTLLLQLLATPQIPYTHVILDEFHERQPDLEVTMALLRLALKQGQKLKVILVSATIDIDDWQGYLEGFDVAVFRQTETEHRVHQYYLEQFCPVLNMAPPRPSQLTFAETTVVDNTIFVAQYLLAYLNSMCMPHHAAIIFLPGRAHVDQVQMWIEHQMHHRMTAIPWHSGVDLPVIQAAIKRPAGHKQKIYVATDIAEVSITIPDLVFVIDLCLVKRPQINIHQEASVMFPPLSTQYISKSSIAQRRGRVGRTQQGFYFCCLPSDLISHLPEHSPAPIVNSRIDELALHVLQVVQNPVALFGLCCSQPTIQSIRTSMRTLCDAGLIIPSSSEEEATTEDGSSGAAATAASPTQSAWNEPIIGETAAFLQEGVKIDRYRATFVGKLAQVMPVSVAQSVLIFYGFLTGLESLMILAASCANLPLPFMVNTPSLAPQQQNNNRRGGGRNGGRGFVREATESIGRAMELAELSMKEHSRHCGSDVVAAMGLVLAFKLEAAGGANVIELDQWCAKQHVSREKLQAILDLEEHVKFELGAFVPFRDVDDAQVQQNQLTRLDNVVRAMICTAFAPQALEVTAEGSMRFKIKEGAHGIFTDLAAVPDLHTPSSIRWEVGTVVVPVTLSLRHSHLLGSYTTAMPDLKMFYLSCLLFAHRLRYEAFEDEAGQYYEFVLTFHGRSRTLEADGATGKAIVEFRAYLESISGSLAAMHATHTEEHKVPSEATVSDMNTKQRHVVGALEGLFFGDGFKSLELHEIQQGEEEITRVSAITA
jgi:hypothetical protein